MPDELGLLIVKPVREELISLGVTQGRRLLGDAASRSWNKPGRLDADILYEQFIEGDEVTVPVLGTGEGTPAHCR